MAFNRLDLKLGCRFLAVLAIYSHFGVAPRSRAVEPDYAAELPRIPATEPVDALARFRVAAGFHMELAAAEPLVSSPVAVAFDEQGRMYVVEMRGYSEHRDEKLSRIRLLADTNDDGQFDQATVFAEQLLWPTAVACWQGGVFVADAPDIWYLKDTDGDGAADTKRRVFNGFGTANVQGLLNTFLWQFDNRIHGTASSNGGEITPAESPDAKSISVRGRDFSFDPRSLDFRAESGGAQHGMTFDDWGRKFVCSNSDHAQQVMFDDRYLGRNPQLAAPSARISIAADGPQAEVFRISPVEPWRIVRTRLRVQGITPGIIEGGGRAAGYFTGATGLTMVRGDAFSDSLRGLLVVGDVGGNLVHRKRLRPNGLKTIAERVDEASELIASTDTWFRPAQFANGPDGALYVIDVCREVIEHPHSLPPQIKQHLDLDSGRDRGRIYRLVPEDYKRRATPRLDRASSADLVNLLKHANAWHRETAARLLYERQDSASVTPLVELASSADALPLGCVHAMYALAGLGQLNERLLIPSLDARDAHVREHAIHLTELLPDQSPKLRRKLVGMTQDDDLHVRYQLAFTLGYLPLEEKIPALAELFAHDPGDRWLRLACLSSLNEGASQVLTTLLKSPSLRGDERAIGLFTALATQVVRKQPREDLAHLIRTLDELPLEELPLVSYVLIAFNEDRVSKTSSFVESVPAEVMPLVERLVGKSVAAARTAATDESLSPEVRARAVRTFSLASFNSIGEILSQLLTARQPQEVQQAALNVLDGYVEPQAGKAILLAWPSLSPATRRSATEVLLARTERVRLLFAAIEAGQFMPAELEPNGVELLKHHPDAAIRQQAAQLLSNPSNTQRQEVVNAYRPALTMSGDTERGKPLFKKHCAACHRVENEGHELGPNLAALKDRGAEAIMLNMLDPNREVNPQYLSYVLATREGRVLSGILAAETATSVTLKRADGQSDVVLRDDIEALRSSGMSLMPEGLEKELSPQSMADVIAYLLSLK